MREMLEFLVLLVGAVNSMIKLIRAVCDFVETHRI